MKPFAVIIVVLALAAVASVAYVLSAQASGTQLFAPKEAPAVARLAQERGSDFIYYNDTNNSFSIKYPIGYSAQRNPESSAYVRFSAFNPGGVSEESVEVYLMDGSYSQADFDSDAASLDSDGQDYSAKLLSKEKSAINGRDAFVTESEMSLGYGENVWVKSATVNCGQYAARIVAVVPWALSTDRVVADYMVGSFTC